MARDPDRQIVEDAITAALERAVGTAPSPGFLARVRERAAAERVRAATRRRRWGYGFAASVPIVFAVATIATVERRGPTLRDLPVRTAAVVPSPSPLAPARSVSPGPPRGRRPDPSIRPRAPRAIGHGRPMVEPGQTEALARLAAAGPGRAPGDTFVVIALDPGAALPELRPRDVPRFEPKPLQLKPAGWDDLTSEAGGTASDAHEGSDS